MSEQEILLNPASAKSNRPWSRDLFPTLKQRVRAEALMRLTAAQAAWRARPRLNARSKRLAALVCAGALLALLVVGFVSWSSHRLTHVVSQAAFVKGHVADLGTRLDGVVADVLVEPGESVEAGQVVALMQTDRLLAEVQRSEARHEGAVYELEASRGRAEETGRRLEQYVRLGRNAFVSQSQVEEARSAHRVALALVERARASRDETAADLRATQADLAQAEIRSPDSGVVVRRIVQPGGSVLVGQPIISLWLGGVWVEAWIDESDIGSVEVGQRATVTVQSENGREYEGTIRSIGVSTDFELPETDVPQPRDQRMRRTPIVAVRVELDDPSPRLFPGMSAVVAIDRSNPTTLAEAAENRTPVGTARHFDRESVRP